MRSKIRAAAALASVAMLSLTACSGNTTSSTSASASAKASTSAQASGSVAAPATGKPSGEAIVVYTNSNSDGRAEWLTEEAKKAGFNITIQGQGGGDTTNKLIAEKANPVADVVFGLNNMYYEQLEKESVLTDYTPAWSKETDEKLGDDDASKTYWPVVQQGIVLAYNGDKLTADKAPKDWTELGTKPEFKGRYQTETGLGGATSQLVIAGILTRYQDPKGEMGVSEEGWKQIEQFFANGSPAEKGVDLYARMKNDTVDAGQMWTSGIPGFESKYGIKTGIMTPEVGVPYAIEQVALVKGTKKEEEAKRFTTGSVALTSRPHGPRSSTRCRPTTRPSPPLTRRSSSVTRTSSSRTSTGPSRRPT